jgi:rhodanese-related sulfurtransferase
MVREITVRELAAKLAGGESVNLLDVRQPQEHAFAALPNSQLIPLGELSRRCTEIQPPDNATLVVYCHHGVRSLRAANILAQLGFRGAVSLAGGIDAWSQEIDPSIPRY